jgi:hypothetical protein
MKLKDAFWLVCSFHCNFVSFDFFLAHIREHKLFFLYIRAPGQLLFEIFDGHINLQVGLNHILVFINFEHVVGGSLALLFDLKSLLSHRLRFATDFVFGGLRCAHADFRLADLRRDMFV